MERKLHKHGTRLRTRWSTEQYQDKEDNSGDKKWGVLDLFEKAEKIKSNAKNKPRDIVDNTLQWLDDMKKNILWIKDKNKWGRPTKKTIQVVAKLIEWFMMDFTIEEACAYAWINKTTFHDWCNKNAEFSNLMHDAQRWQQILAKSVVYQALKNNNSNVAMQVLEKRDERYSNKWETDVSLNINMAFVQMMENAKRKRLEERDWKANDES